MTTSLLAFHPLFDSQNIALPYALTQVQQHAGEVHPEIQRILDIFKLLSVGQRGILDFDPVDTEEIPVALTPTDTDEIYSIIGKRVTYGDEHDDQRGYPSQGDRLTHDYHEFARWLTEYHKFVQTEDDFGGELTIKLFEADDEMLNSSILEIAWFISSEGIELIHQHKEY